MRVICVKWGTKYNHDYVNKLYGMVLRYAPSDFEFVCVTEDPTGIRSEVKIHDFPAGNDFEVWWNKMHLFHMFNDGKKNLFFDLDVIIHGSLDHLFDFKADGVTIIRSRWKDTRHLDKFDTLYNSSVISWTDGKYLWDQFNEDREKYMSIYKGIDRFFWNEKSKINVFDEGHIYSYWKGASLEDREPGKYRADYSVCILNHKPKPHEITTSWIHDYWVE